MDSALYLAGQERMFKDYESLCRRCGACCGLADGDPCIHLSKDKVGRYFCDIYERRLGEQETVSGKKFNCIDIREIKSKFDLPQPDCGYHKH